MIVKFQKPIQFLNKCGCVVDEKELAKAIVWFAKGRPVTRLKTIFMHVKYPAVSIYEQKVHVHRLLKMYWLKEDLDFNDHVHHIDGNKLNDRPDNLTVWDASYHLSKTNKGRKHTKEHNHKIGLANKKRKGMKFKKVYSNPKLLKGDTK